MTTGTRALNDDFALRGSFFARVSGTVSLWLSRAAARRDLAALSERDLLDVGLDADEVAREIAKPFWVA